MPILMTASLLIPKEGVYEAVEDTVEVVATEEGEEDAGGLAQGQSFVTSVTNQETSPTSAPA